jgi:hypothetical protein
MVIHVCNSIYSGGKDQEDQSLMPNLGKNVVGDLISTNKLHAV